MEEQSHCEKQCKSELYHFRCNLLKVAQSLNHEDIKDLVYISPECPEEIQGGREYFWELEKKGLIDPRNYDYVLDRLTDIGKEDVAFALMESICQSPHTPCALSTHLLARLIASGKEDLTIQLMMCKCRVQRLPNELTSSCQTLLLVFNAKEALCKTHRAAVAKLREPAHVRNEVGGIIEKYFCQSVLQSTKTNMKATVYQWPSLSVLEDRGTLGELLGKTLGSIFSFTDAFHMHITTIISTDSIQLKSIEPSAKACNLAFDGFIEVLADTEWNHGGRGEAIDHRNLKDCPIGIQARSACKSIADICEGLPCGKGVEEAEQEAKNEIFTVETSIYACWYSTPMYHWMRALIQMAVSSKLDLTKYCGDIMKVVADHREPIIKHYVKFTQIFGEDIMKVVDPALNISEYMYKPSSNRAVATISASDNLSDCMAIYGYIYLLQLAALACNCYPSKQSEMIERFLSLHRKFYESNSTAVMESSLGVVIKIVTAAHAQVEDLRAKAIQLCPEASAERLLLYKILHDVDTEK